MHRRDFVAKCACALSAAALAGCASLVIRRVTPVNGRVELALSHYQELSERESSLAILPDGHDDPIYILTDAAGEFTALSSMCTHLGCTVDIGQRNLVCPCHGSTFDRTGRVVKGPAERNLVRFPTRLSSDGVLIIDLTRGA
jgi:cytochrome b6-f complex iron-sulfur subunit